MSFLTPYPFLVSIMISLLAHPAYARPEVLGVLLEVESQDILRVAEARKLISEYHLQEKKFYSIMKVVLFDLQKRHQPEREKLLEFCEKMNKISGVKHCELNQKLEPTRVQGNTRQENEYRTDAFCKNRGDSNQEEIEGLLAKVNKIQEVSCHLIPREKAPHENPSLSMYWAQEYTGADLLRDRMKIVASDRPGKVVAVWDTKIDGHASKVSHLIASPHNSAPIPLKHNARLAYTALNEMGDFMEANQKAFKKCRGKSNCPNYINNSMYWCDSSLIQRTFEKMHNEFGTLVIVSADNNSGPVDDQKMKSAQGGVSIIVASINTHGLPSVFTNYADKVAIAAPSDYQLTSYFQKNPPSLVAESVKFSGTSGATPQVTAALVAFTLITGHALTYTEAIRLLEKTSLPLPGLPRESKMGSGMLNSYKIGEVAFRLNSLCGPVSEQVLNVSCIKGALESEDLYTFSNTNNHALIQRARALFPGCPAAQTEEAPTTIVSCQQKREVFTQMRQAALLTSDPELFEFISCLSNKNGYSENAQFYTNMANRLRQTDEQIIDSVRSGTPDNLPAKHLRYFNIYGFALAGANLEGAVLPWANLHGANLEGANLAGANLKFASLANANLSKANLAGANLEFASLANANISKANLEGADLRNLDLSHVDLSLANLQGANLQGANLQGANLQGANLQGANLQGANLMGVNFQDAKVF